MLVPMLLTGHSKSEALKQRTSTDTVTLNFRSGHDTPSTAYMSSTTQRFDEFVESALGMSTMEFIMRLEAHNISGTKGAFERS